MSKRGKNWRKFADEVETHIEEYTVPQYGDEGDDQVTHYTAEECIKQAQKYLARFGRNSRPGQEHLDLKKAAHYIQMATEKMEVENATC
jgi:hypothetical protein